MDDLLGVIMKIIDCIYENRNLSKDAIKIGDDIFETI